MEIKDKIFDWIERVIYEIKLIEDYDLNISDKKIKNIVDSLKKRIKIISNHLNKESDYLKNNAEWKKYSICFFGETNAGKSTIIETLLSEFKDEKRNGETIGTGEKDFTKEFSSHKIKLNGITFNITDMPGIEGDEGIYQEQIKQAVTQSHTIFYVNGTDKKPETGTVKKIKSYLNNQGEVYSILNIRGKAGSYQFEHDRDTIFTEKNKKAIKAQKKVFEKVFEKTYKGDLSFNALMAFCAKCVPERKDLIRAQKNYEKTFGNLENAYNFSNFNTLTNFLPKLSKNAEQKIAATNISMVVNILDNLICTIDEIYYNDFKQYLLSDVKGITQQSINNVNTIFKKYDAFIRHSIDNELSKLKNNLRREIYNAIDEEQSKNYINSKIKEESNKFNNIIKKRLQELLKDLKSEIEIEFKELKSKLNLTLSISSINIEINIDEILEKLTTKLNEIFKTIGVLGLEIAGIIALLLGPQFILGIIAGVISILKNIWKFFFSDNRDSKRKKREAKDKANRALNNVTIKLQSKIQKDLIRELAKNKRQIDKELNKIHETFDTIENFTIAFSNSIINIKNIYKEIITIRNIYDNN